MRFSIMRKNYPNQMMVFPDAADRNLSPWNPEDFPEPGMNDTPVVRFRSYAKINWYLHILGLRSDGYHDIDSLVQLISLHDEIEISPSDSVDRIICNYKIPTGKNSLLIRALNGLRERNPILRRQHFSIRIRKSIPPCGGLGGGSSNVAGLLCVFSRFYPSQYALSDLSEHASTLGSDVPFFASGYSVARMQGRGEKLSPVHPGPERFLVLAFPEFGVPTKWAYREWDRRNRQYPHPGGLPTEVHALLNAGGSPNILELIRNDFEDVVFSHYPALLTLKQIMIDEGCHHAFMSGSGSTLVGVAGNDEQAQEIAESLRNRGFQALPVSTRLPESEPKNTID
ncbi:MAG TPA: 4-(cytidine 5'-diphospho)-2-C-methyl-D-erythritol kinase [Atribacteraceae bacterium]|nr:4-(cytidine 5'-diphospho)-2-C-methyl-D-erythritol kinase [Atribacteraceae bacterium]